MHKPHMKQKWAYQTFYKGKLGLEGSAPKDRFSRSFTSLKYNSNRFLVLEITHVKRSNLKDRSDVMHSSNMKMQKAVLDNCKGFKGLTSCKWNKLL